MPNYVASADSGIFKAALSGTAPVGWSGAWDATPWTGTVVSGQSPSSLFSRVLVADAGTFTSDGSPAALNRNYSFQAGADGFLLAGKAAASHFEYAPLPGDFSLEGIHTASHLVGVYPSGQVALDGATAATHLVSVPLPGSVSVAGNVAGCSLGIGLDPSLYEAQWLPLSVHFNKVAQSSAYVLQVRPAGAHYALPAMPGVFAVAFSHARTVFTVSVSPCAVNLAGYDIEESLFNSAQRGFSREGWPWRGRERLEGQAEVIRWTPTVDDGVESSLRDVPPLQKTPSRGAGWPASDTRETLDLVEPLHWIPQQEDLLQPLRTVPPLRGPSPWFPGRDGWPSVESR